MPAPALRRTLLLVTDRRALLYISEAQAGPQATAPGSTEVTAASGMPGRIKTGITRLSRTPAMPDGPAAMASAETPRRPLPAEGYDSHPLADDPRTKRSRNV